MNSSIRDIDSYLKQQPLNIRAALEELRQTIQKAVPDAEEIISYDMPAFRFHGNLVWFAAFKKHYSIFFRKQVLQKFKEELKPYDLSNSGAAIKIPLGKPIPAELLSTVVKYGAKVNLENEQLRKKDD